MINCQPCLMIQSFHKFNLCMLIYLNVKSHLHVSLSYLGIFPDLTYRMMFTRTAKKELFVRIYYTINFPLLLFFCLPNVFVWNHCYYHINLYNSINILNCFVLFSVYTNINVDSRPYPAILFNEQDIILCNWSLVYWWLVFVKPTANMYIHLYEHIYFI